LNALCSAGVEGGRAEFVAGGEKLAQLVDDEDRPVVRTGLERPCECRTQVDGDAQKSEGLAVRGQRRSGNPQGRRGGEVGVGLKLGIDQ